MFAKYKINIFIAIISIVAVKKLILAIKNFKKKKLAFRIAVYPVWEALTRKLSDIKFCLQNRSNLILSYQQHHEKPAQCKFENKSAGQLPSHCTADQHIFSLHK